MNLTYDKCAQLVERARDKWSKPIAGHKTRVERRDAYGTTSYALKVHETDVLRFYSNGTIVLNSGGWHTPLTANRISYAAGICACLYRRRLVIGVGEYWSECERYMLVDGMSICEGHVEDGGSYEEYVTETRQRDRERARERAAEYYVKRQLQGINEVLLGYERVYRTRSGRPIAVSYPAPPDSDAPTLVDLNRSAIFRTRIAQKIVEVAGRHENVRLALVDEKELATSVRLLQNGGRL